MIEPTTFNIIAFIVMSLWTICTPISLWYAYFEWPEFEKEMYRDFPFVHATRGLLTAVKVLLGATATITAPLFVFNLVWDTLSPDKPDEES